MEARCEPRLVADPNFAFHPDLQVPRGEELLVAIRRRVHPRHDEALTWYRAEQASILAKVLVTRFAAGFEKVFMGMAYDWDWSVGALSTRNPFLGLLDRRGRPWPAFHALRILVEKLDGFERAERIAAPEGIELYRFTFVGDRHPVWVAWLSEAEPRGLDDPLPTRSVRLEAIRGPATAHLIPTEGDEAVVVETGGQGALELVLTSTPVIIESEGP
jgi:hypothetical protein